MNALCRNGSEAAHRHSIKFKAHGLLSVGPNHGFALVASRSHGRESLGLEANQCHSMNRGFTTTYAIIVMSAMPMMFSQNPAFTICGIVT